jgi:hypothetical protein
MPCVPAPARHPVAGLSADRFAFSPTADSAGRTFQNLSALWSVPWVALWAVTLESLNPENYRPR